MEAVGLSHPGYHRENNEDCYYIDIDQGLFILCDGMGGHLGGEVASQMAVDTLSEALSLQFVGMEPAAVFRQAVEEANRVILERSQNDPKLQGMGTTLTALYKTEAGFLVGHVGDSSLHVFDGKICRKITRDHTLAESLRSQGLPEDQQAFAAYSHILTRAVGISSEIRMDEMVLEPQGDELFLLASDGLTDCVPEEDITEIFKMNIDLEEKAQVLIDTALQRGGYDNVTVVLVQLQEGGRS